MEINSKSTHFGVEALFCEDGKGVIQKGPLTIPHFCSGLLGHPVSPALYLLWGVS